MDQVSHQECQSHRGWVTNVAISPDNVWLATVEGMEMMSPWTVHVRKLEAPETAVHAITFPSDGGLDVAHPPHLAFSPDSSKLCTFLRSSLFLFDVALGCHVATMLGPDWGLSAIEWSPDSEWIVTGGPRYLAIWDAQVGIQDDPPLIPVIETVQVTNKVTSLAIHPNCRNFVAGHIHGSIHHWDVGIWGERGSQAPCQTDVRFDCNGYHGEVMLCFDGTGERLVAVFAGGLGGACVMYCASTGVVQWTHSTSPLSLFCVALSPNGTTLVVGEGDIARSKRCKEQKMCVRFLRAQDGEEIAAIAAHSSSRVISMTFNSTGKILVSAGLTTVNVWTDL